MKPRNKQNKFSLALPGFNEHHSEDYYVLAGDVGGTKTNLALCLVTLNGIEEKFSNSYPSKDFAGLVDTIEQFLSECDVRPARAAFGVAGPVIHGKADLTNLGWILDSKELMAALQIDRLTLLNDLEATAYGLADLQDNEALVLHRGDPTIGGNMAIIAPGTGLGEAGLYFDGQWYHPFPTEGGHCDFSPRTNFDIGLYNYLKSKYDIVSWEKAVSGPAIVDIYHYLLKENNLKVPGHISERFSNEDNSAVISSLAIEKDDVHCTEAMNHFVRYLARECSNLVLKMKSTGGLFIGGGIPPKILPLLDSTEFMQHYLDGDRMENLLTQVPIRVILDSETAMVGAAYYAAYGKW